MKRKRHWPLWSMGIGIVLYTLASYLILLRDYFLLERIGVTLGNAAFETTAIALAEALHANLSSIVFLSAALLLLTLGYLGALIRPLSSEAFLKATMVIIICCLLSFPSLSTDVFDYNNNNRLAFIHQANPWINSADNFPEDSEIYYGSWTDRASVYPPVSFLAGGLVYVIFGANPLWAAFGFKLVGLATYAGICWLIWRQNSATKWHQLTLFAWNPLVLIEFVGNGHNDLLVGLCALAALYFFTNKKVVLSGFWIALGFLAKFTVILQAPFVVWALIKESHLKITAHYLLVVSAICFAGLVLMGESLGYLASNVGLQLDLYQRSFPIVIREILTFAFSNTSPFIDRLPKILGNLFFGVCGAYLFFKTTKENLVEKWLAVMWAYLAFASPMIQPWYFGWFFPAIVLLPKGRLKVALITLSLSLLASYPLFYASLYANPTFFGWQIIFYLVMMVPPLIMMSLPSAWYTRVLQYSKPD